MANEQTLNDSIIFNNLGGGQYARGADFDMEISPEDVVEGEFIERPASTSRRRFSRSLVTFGAVALLTGAGVAGYLSSYGQSFFHGNLDPLALASLAGPEQPNPFFDPNAKAKPTQLLAGPAQQSTPIEHELPVMTEEVAPQPRPVETVSGASSLNEDPSSAAPGVAQGEVVPNIADLQVQQPSDGSGVTDSVEKVAAVEQKEAPDVQPAAEEKKPKPEQPAVKPQPSPERTIVQPQKAPSLPVESKPAPTKPDAITKSPTKPQPPKSQNVPRKVEPVEVEKIREVSLVKASQIGLREFTRDLLVVATGGKSIEFRVSDVLPSGERIEAIDPVTMTVVTDRSVIRIQP